MEEQEWVDTIAIPCEFARVVSGGAMCDESGCEDYCDFERCPKIMLEPKVKRGLVWK